MIRLSIFCVVLILCAVSASAQATSTDPCGEVKTQFAHDEARLKDWPALARYRNENATVASPAKDEKRVVFMGDSITDGWRNPRYGGFFPGKPYIDRGISGQTTPQMLLRFRQDVIALKPKVVVILAGTNDIASNTGPMPIEAIEDNLASMSELARAHGIRVVLSSVLPISDYEKNKEGKPIIRSVQRPPDEIKALNDWMKRYVSENGLTYLDYFSAMVDDKGFLKAELSEDGLHPNAKGYAIMSPLAEQAIAAALKKK
ncbi:MAG TPA: SGNH/GDSL hydrolase family protein [Pyrinomonadaceae bacterium]|nr:SGNH/GDSL hydrolase family protein [Pyrinomonadaceae bacterium]